MAKETNRLHTSIGLQFFFHLRTLLSLSADSSSCITSGVFFLLSLVKSSCVCRYQDSRYGVRRETSAPTAAGISLFVSFARATEKSKKMSSKTSIVGAKNLQIEVDGSTLYLYCDLSKDFGISSSGKSTIISSSSGNKALGKSNAFIGLNIFTSNLERRDLTAEGVGALKSANYTELSSGFSWRIDEKDGVTLCIKIDFTAVTERLASSGKSKLLATTGGNKPIAATGLLCGLNCYYAATACFDVSKLSDSSDSQLDVKCGDIVDVGNGFQLHYKSSTDVTLSCTYDKESAGDGDTVALPPFRLKDLVISLLISPPKPKREKKEAATSSESSPSGDLPKHPSGFVVKSAEKSPIRNVTVVCTLIEKGKYNIAVSFDATLKLGWTSSGKSLTVASTGGFQLLADVNDAVVCRLNLNVYRPTAPLTATEMEEAARRVLNIRPKEEWPALSFKVVWQEASKQFNIADSQKDELKTAIQKIMSETE